MYLQKNVNTMQATQNTSSIFTTVVAMSVSANFKICAILVLAGANVFSMSVEIFIALFFAKLFLISFWAFRILCQDSVS